MGRPHPLEYPTLSTELPGCGWPVGALVELLLQQAGVGEVRLFRPALGAVGKRPIALLHVKRRGPTLAEPLSIALQPTPVSLSNRRAQCEARSWMLPGTREVLNRCTRE